MKKLYENTYAVYSVTDEVLQVRYKKDQMIDLKAAQIIVRDRVMLQEGNEMPVLCDIRHLKWINKEARDYMALEGSLWISAIAYLIGPPVTDAISSLYLETQTQKVPSRSFTNRAEALDFLKANGIKKK